MMGGAPRSGQARMDMPYKQEKPISRLGSMGGPEGLFIHQRHKEHTGENTGAVS